MLQERQVLTCQEVVELVTDYLEGSLSPELRTLFEAHLAYCVGCSHYVQQILFSMKTLRRLELPRAVNTEQDKEELLVLFRRIGEQNAHEHKEVS